MGIESAATLYLEDREIIVESNVQLRIFKLLLNQTSIKEFSKFGTISLSEK